MHKAAPWRPPAHSRQSMATVYQPLTDRVFPVGAPTFATMLDRRASCWRYHRDAVQGSRSRQMVVISHDAVELVAQLQSCCEMKGVWAAQLVGVERRGSFECGGGACTR